MDILKNTAGNVLSYNGLPLGTTWGAAPAAFVEATGGTITYDGDYKIHTFTTTGDLEVTVGGEVNVLVVAGGAGGSPGVGGSYYGSAGGGGFVIEDAAYSVGVETITATVGAGGAPETAGGDSSFGSIDCSRGLPCIGNTQLGGDSKLYSGALGDNAVCLHQGGGGAGAGGDAGIAGGKSKNNDGGDGIKSSITGSEVGYGGGGASPSTGCGQGDAVDGGGSGAAAAPANRGGGGHTSGYGGSGVVIIRYKYQ